MTTGRINQVASFYIQETTFLHESLLYTYSLTGKMCFINISKNLFIYSERIQNHHIHTEVNRFFLGYQDDTNQLEPCISGLLLGEKFTRSDIHKGTTSISSSLIHRSIKRRSCDAPVKQRNTLVSQRVRRN
jgi:hypothetical protein